MTTIKPIGGVRSVGLFRPCGIKATWLDGHTARISTDKRWPATEVPLMEDKSLYGEQLRQEKGLCSVVHELRMTADAAESAPWLDAEFLRRTASEGAVARIEMMSGEVLWAGISPRFGTEQPLRLAGIETSSELSPRQRPQTVLTLHGEDCDFAYRQKD
ncbi:MAG: hypothetical protein K2F95_00050 [Alistipes sp.]|nr:hypothetical protein [Alistipes sp.]MDE7129113.1 hypothetical protein [Alistipes sp.]